MERQKSEKWPLFTFFPKNGLGGRFWARGAKIWPRRPFSGGAYIDHFLIRVLFLSPARLWKVFFRNCQLAKISIFGLTLRCRKSVLNRGTINPGGAGIPDFPRFLTFLRFWVLRPPDGGFPGNPGGRPEIHFWGLKIDFLTTFHRFLTVLRPLEGGSGTHFWRGSGPLFEHFFRFRQPTFTFQSYSRFDISLLAV